MWPTSFELLYSALWRILPGWLISALEWLPSRETKRMNQFRDVAMKVSRPIFDRQLKEVANDVNPAEKDVVNVLGMKHELHHYIFFSSSFSDVSSQRRCEEEHERY